MDDKFVLSTLNGLVLGLLGFGIMSWVQAIQLMRRGRPLLAWEARRPVPWGLIHLIAAIVLVLFSSAIGPALLQQFGVVRLDGKMSDLPLQQQIGVLVSSTAGQLLCLPLFLLVTSRLSRATARDFGWSSEHLLGDIKLGAVAFAMLAPIVFGIQIVTTRFQESKHEILEMLKADQGGATIAAVFFTAAIGAPILEEFFFRVLLQGWLEKLIDRSVGAVPLLVGGYDAPVAPADAAVVPAQAELITAENQGAAGLVPSTNPYASPSPVVMAADGAMLGRRTAADLYVPPPTLRRLGWLPIVISSVVFALLHWSHGPDWIALTVLAMGFGFLYQRTHRIVPSLVVHALLNSFSLLAMFVSQKLAP